MDWGILGIKDQHFAPTLHLVLAVLWIAERVESPLDSTPLPINKLTMQSLLAILALLLGSAVAGPMTITSADDSSQQNREISASEYLRKIFENSVSLSKSSSCVSNQFENIVASLKELGLNEAAEIVQQVDLRQILQDSDLSSVTMFMPSDKAVKKFTQELPESLVPSQSNLKLLAKAWIVDAVIPSSQIRNNDVQRSVNGAKLRFNKYDLPNQRETKILTVNGARITGPDNRIPSSDSIIIHIVDKVIYPLPVGNVVETLADVPAFSQVMELAHKAGLTEALSNTDPITMFVPTNAAFQSLPSGVLEDLSKNKTKLASVLKYHLSSEDAKYSASILQEQRIMTAQGHALTITPENGRIILNKQMGESKMAKVIRADVPTTNGVLHIIDRVLTPMESHYVLV